MSLRFQSLSSGSSGNCLLLWSDHARVIIDCGLPTMTRARELFANSLGNPAHVDAVIVSHMHSDHINYYSLRVIEECGLKLMVNERCLNQLRGKHFKGYKFKSIQFQTFSGRSFGLGDLTIQPFEVPHSPGFPNCGFVVRCRDNGKWSTAVIATDFHSGRAVLEHFVDADFIFAESNHDPGLLAKYYNPNSRFHMSNPNASEMLRAAYEQSRNKPHTIMLGHLSARRNTERHAFEEMRRAFRENGTQLGFRLFAAPRYESSVLVEV